MLQSYAVTEAVTSLNDAERILQITRSNDPDFFPEWRDALLELTDLERQTLDRLKKRYLYYAADNTIAEGTLNIIMLAPLLELGHLCDPPFKLRAEQSVRVTLESSRDDLTRIYRCVGNPRSILDHRYRIETLRI
jgi:hypothetical protein